MEGGDTHAAATTLGILADQLITLLEPYANAMPTPFPHTVLILTNGSTLRTTANTPAEIAGMINAGVQKIYPVADLDGVAHNLMVDAILDFYEVTS
jgi:hypothetical protein